MRRVVSVNILIFFAVALMIASVIVALVSLFPAFPGKEASHLLIDDSFGLTPLETRRQGLGSFRGGENVSIHVRSVVSCPVNFSIISYNGFLYSTISKFETEYSFVTEPDYYEVVFIGSNTTNDVFFSVWTQGSEALFPFGWLSTPAKIGLFLSFGFALLPLFKKAYVESSEIQESEAPILNRKGRNVLLILLTVSLSFWLILLAVNTNSLATFDNWYTDNARNSYSASLLTKTGISLFGTSLGKLAGADNSYFKFVTWPEMPHLYPLGSVVLFLPFGVLLQSGISQILVFKMEIVLFLLFSHVCFYFFMKRFWAQNAGLPLKLMGLYIMYLALVVYSANGMFDSVSLLFALVGLSFFLNGRYNFFILSVAISASLKYQAVVFLFPLLALGLMKLLGQNGVRGVVRSKVVLVSIFLFSVVGFTAFQSWPFVLSVRPEFVTNGVNVLYAHSQISWVAQTFAALLTLCVTVVYAVYMFYNNSLLSLSAVFMLLPVFTFPYFQIWYIPFLFTYAVIGRRDCEVKATALWLVFMVGVLSFGSIAFDPLKILTNLQNLLNL